MWNRKKSSTVFWILATVFLSTVIYRKWFFTANLYTWGDWGFDFSETVREWLRPPQVWIDAFLGRVDIGLSQYLPVRVFYGILSQFLTFVWFDRVVFLFPSVILPAIGVFLLVKSITKNNIAAFIGPLVYSLSTYVLVLNSGHLTLSVAFGLAPFIFLLFKRAILEESFFYAIFAGLVAFICASYEVRAFYLVGFLLISYFLFNIVIGKFKNLKEVITCGFYAGVPFILVVLLNSYWIFGFLKTSQAFKGIVIDQAFFGLGHYNVQRVFTLFHPFWTGTHRLSWGEIQIIPLRFWLIPFIAFFGLWLNRRNKEVIFWAFVALVGIFLTKQTGEPFTDVYAWLYKHFPGFNVFRESSKFNFYIALSYAVLIGAFISWFWQQKIKFYLKIIATVLTASLFLYNAKPVITGEWARLLTPRHVPSDYLILKKFIQNQPDFFRTLYVPRDSRWGYWDSTHPKLSATELVQLEWRELNNYDKTGLEYSAFEEVMNIFNKPFSDKLLDYSAVKYVVVPLADKENEEIFIFPKEVSRKNYIDSLDKISYLKRLNIGTNELVVYENENYLSHFNIAPKIDFKIIYRSPTKYELVLNSKPTEEAKLHFSESYNHGWKIRIGKFSWFDSLFVRNYFLPDSNHFKSEFGLNEFTIPVNKPGEKITVYFAPQAYVNLGSVISLITLVASLNLLLILWLTRKH